MPKTKLGKWSVWLIPVMFVLFYLGPSLSTTLYEGVSAGNTLFQDIGNRPLLALAMLAGFGAGVTAFVTGLVGILKQKERALLVYGSTIIGAALIVFLILEIAFPH
ncbi:hypothetical protein JR338_05755 [Chloroflexota bacterium]|nr:hypothetical protein JR338_05755 [Chloroflexota bacterium]